MRNMINKRIIQNKLEAKLKTFDIKIVYTKMMYHIPKRCDFIPKSAPE